MRNVLITGGEGFLGTHLVRLLLEKRGFTITVFDKLDREPRQGLSARVGYVKGNILSTEDVSRAFNERGPFDTVFHLASAMPNKTVSPQTTWDISVIGTTNLVSAAVKSKTRSFIFTSTNVTYGIPAILPVTEETPIHPLEIYGKSKAQAEHELARFKGQINIQIFRCPIISGVGRLGLQSILFEFISENRNIYVLGNGSNRYQFVDADDLSDALEKASLRKGFDMYVVGGDGVMSLKQLYQTVIDAAGSTSKVISLPKAPALMLLSLLDRLNISPIGIYQYTMLGRSLYADTTNIKKKLKWQPKKTNGDSFIENYRWYVQNKDNFTVMGSGARSDNRSLPKMGILRLLKVLS